VCLACHRHLPRGARHSSACLCIRSPRPLPLPLPHPCLTGRCRPPVPYSGVARSFPDGPGLRVNPWWSPGVSVCSSHLLLAGSRAQIPWWPGDSRFIGDSGLGGAQVVRRSAPPGMRCVSSEWEGLWEPGYCGPGPSAGASRARSMLTSRLCAWIPGVPSGLWCSLP
jgi:hypothetical protein